MAISTVVDILGVREINIPDDESISFGVRAPTTIFGNLEVVSGSLITDGFAVSGSFDVPGDLSVGGNLAVTGTFSVPGNLSVGVLDVADLYASDDLFVSGAATLAGTLSAGVVDVVDLYASDDLFVSGTGIIAGGLTVTGGSSEISGSLRVSGSFVQRQQYGTTGAGTYNVTIADDNRLLEVNPGGGSTTLVLPSDLDVGFFFYFRQTGTGTVTVSGSSGVTVNSTAGSEPSLSAQWGHGTADKRSGTEWVVAGDIA